MSKRYEVSYWDGESSGRESLSVVSVFYKTDRVVRSEETSLDDVK